jgi:hypothetical protein
VLRVGGTGLLTRPLQVFLSALGIAIGIAAIDSDGRRSCPRPAVRIWAGNWPRSARTC